MEDISSFLGPAPAPEVKRALPLIAKLEQKDLRALLPKALQYLKGEDLKEADIAALQLKDQGTEMAANFLRSSPDSSHINYINCPLYS